MDDMLHQLERNFIRILGGVENAKFEYDPDYDRIIITFPGPGVSGELRITGQTIERYSDPSTF